MVTNLNNGLLINYGKKKNITSWGVTYPVAFTGVPTVVGTHIYTGTSANSAVIFSTITITKCDGWYTNNEKGDMYWIAIGY